MQRVSPFDYGGEMRNCSELNDTQEQHNCEWMAEWVSLQSSVYPFAVNMLILECLLVVIANFMILLTKCFLYGKTTAPLACIYSLAIADMWLAFLIGFSLFLGSLLPKLIEPPARFTCYMYASEALKMGAIMTTIYHLLALAISHYIVTAHPWSHEDKLKKLTTPMLLMVWICPSAMYFTMFAVHWDETFGNKFLFLCILSYKTVDVRVTTIVLIVLPIVLMCLVYAFLLYIAMRAARPGGSTARKIKNLALTAALLIIGTVVRQRCQQWQYSFFATFHFSILLCHFSHPSVVCWLPNAYMFFFASNRLENPPLVHLITMIVISGLYISKGLLNPLIYAVRVPDIKMALKRMLFSHERFRQMSLQTGITTALRQTNRDHVNLSNHELSLVKSIDESTPMNRYSSNRTQSDNGCVVEI